ncbi:MAG: DUF1559 domain-containing protein [Gemmataceae bacterium]
MLASVRNSFGTRRWASSHPRPDVLRALKVGCSLLICLLVVTFGSSASAEELPSDLNAVPRNAACFLHLRAADIWKHETLTDLRFIVKAAGRETWKTFQEMFAPNPKNIDRLTLVMPRDKDFADLFPYQITPETRSPLVIIHTKKAFDHLRLLEQLAFRDKFYRRNHYYFNENDWRGLVVIDSRTFIVGPEASLHEYFNQRVTEARSRKAGALQTGLERAMGEHLCTMGINPTQFTKTPGFQFLPVPVRPMFEARSWIGTASLRNNIVDVAVQFEFNDQKSAKGGEEAVRAVLNITRQGLAVGLKQAQNELVKDREKVTIKSIPEKFAAVVGIGFLREFDRVLKTLPVIRKQHRVDATLKYDKLTSSQTALAVGLASLTFLGARSYATFQEVTPPLVGFGRDPRQEHLKTIHEALQRYHKDKGTYPPAAIYDKYGRPILSWRVALLPYLGENEKALYNEFRLDEPWDGPNNKRLLQRMPQSYRTPELYSRSPGQTGSLVLTGPGTMFEGPKGVRKKEVLPKTICVVLGAAENATYWTKPGDFLVEPGEPLPDIFPRYTNQVLALLADGSFKELKTSLPKEQLRQMIYRKKGPIAKGPEPMYPEAAWEDFIQIDDIGARRALKTIRKLAANPKTSLPFLKSKLQPIPTLDTKAIAKRIDDLGSEQFRIRTKAQKALTKVGALVVPMLRKELQESLPLEVSTRIRKLIASLADSPVTVDELRAVRSVLVLQEIGNAEATMFLTQLAKGADGAILTIHAKKALERLNDR